MQHFTQAELREIEDRYQDFLKDIRNKFDKERLAKIDKAFNFANAAHNGMRRKSGEPYIIHPIAVAHIVAKKLGLGSTTIVAALLHDVVEDTEFTDEDIRNMFGDKVADIVKGLTKLTGDFDYKQAHTLKKVITTLSEDVRVILVKIADRLHNMQTLEFMRPHKQVKIAGETLFLYVPLAHRLGLYAIKNELEELSFKYKHPEEYQKIVYMLHNKEAQRNYLVHEFIQPIKDSLKAEHIECTVSHRLKNAYSIWNKMQKKGVSFNEIYDILAIRIIIKEKPEVSEKRQCFDVLSLVTDIYKPRPERIRDWITTPKPNGYESLHVTVMGPGGKWVEVQIRTERMDKVAEHGFAAHYRYKDIRTFESELDPWIDKIKEQLNNPNADAFEFLDDFKRNLYSTEISIFSPKGDEFKMPVKSTVADFAYELHTDLGNHCIGAKVNNKLFPITHRLENGDQVEILTSENQKPKLEWLDFAITVKARSKIKDSFKEENKQHIEKGKEIVEQKLKEIKITNTSNVIKKICSFYNLTNKEQLYSEVGIGVLKLDELLDIIGRKSLSKLVKYWNLSVKKRKKDEPLLLPKEEQQEDISYTLAKCCNPIPGEQVLGFLESDNEVTIHRTDCKEAALLLSSQGDKVVDAQWTNFKKQSYLTRIHLEGTDRIGIVNNVTEVISKEHNINMRAIKMENQEGIFKGDVFLYIHSTEDLRLLIEKLSKIKGIEKVTRIEKLND
ncbi:MAG: GTP pyrophosphokinase [Draconibacterium sp.]|nr:MAG: GTP pyrophosphokinase [Draconibacterium sp.]